jgi:hypothetical protein
MIVRIRDQDIKDDAPPQLLNVSVRACAELSQRIRNLQVTARLVVSGA